MTRVFVSYSRNDEAAARRLAADLRERGVVPWLDVEQIRPADDWADAIQHGLDACQQMILLVTPDALASEQVGREWKYYLAHDKPVIPVLIKPARLHYQLNALQYVDLQPDWDAGIARLIGVIGTASSAAPTQIALPVARTSAPTPPPAAPGTVGTPSRRRSPIGWLLAGGLALVVLAGLTAALRTQTAGSGGTPSPTRPLIVAGVTETGDPPVLTAAVTPEAPIPTIAPEASAALAPIPVPTDPPTAAVSVWTPQRTTWNGITYAYVSAGTLNMGSAAGFADEQPVHPQSIAAFWLQQYETTNAEYAACVTAGVCEPLLSVPGFDAPDQPVVYVDWHNAARYCQWRGGALPTEPQWEWAARGPDNRTYPYSNLFQPLQQHYDSAATRSVYATDASWVGVISLTGNAAEWTASAYRPYPYTSAADLTLATITGAEAPVVRGGSWQTVSPSMLTGSSRGYADGGTRTSTIGFRCALPVNALSIAAPASSPTAAGSADDQAADAADDQTDDNDDG